MTTKLEQEEYLYRRAVDIIESSDTDYEKEEFLESLGWHDIILKKAREILVKEFSRENYNPNIHNFGINSVRLRSNGPSMELYHVC